MKNNWKYLSMFFYCLFFAVLTGFLLGGTTGIVAAVIVMGVVLFFMGYEGVGDNDVKCPLLVDLAVLASNFVVILNPHLWVLTVSMGLGAVFDIINRIANKSYNTTSVSAFLNAELRVPAGLEVALMLFLFIDIMKEEMYDNPYVWIIMVLLFVDFLRQVFGFSFFKKTKH